MNQDEFVQSLARQGYGEIVVVEREPGGGLDEHSHPFAARALILAGEIRLVVAGAERSYRAGEVFQLAAGEPHTESYGPQGVRYLVGRK